MDFFARQDQARRNTGLLIVYFFVAVALIILAVNAVVYFFIAYFAEAQVSSVPVESRLPNSAWWYISLLTLMLIASGSLFRFVALARGGTSVAQMVNAREVDLSTGEVNERKYVNVVEEMSIASGVSMPRLYVMDDEPGINAFVAGYRPTEAVMVVTRGTLDNLSRDELQGVVGHEFSHILNGDMRINIRLMAILAGILLIGKIGQILMHSSGRSHRSRGQGMVLGLALFAVGYIGLFFGRLIKAAISRQREFLADASSVQFTRNPRGIAGALYKIQQSVNGTVLNNGHAEDMSHMCFGETMTFRLKNLLATHPPLEERINAVSPHFITAQKFDKPIDQVDTSVGPEGSMGFSGDVGYSTNAQQLTDTVGNPGPQHLQYAEALHQRFDVIMLEMMHQASGAEALIYALVVDKMDHQAARAFLERHIDQTMIQRVDHLLVKIHDMEKHLRLPLIDLAIPALKQLTNEKAEHFLYVLEGLIKLDKKFSLLEFVLLTLLQQRLDRNSTKVNRIRYRSFKSLQPEIRLLLSVLAQCSGNSGAKLLAAYEAQMSTFSNSVLTLIPIADISVNRISHALYRLNQMPAMMKRSFLSACADLVIHDGIVMAAEAELLRAIAESLDCPMPPLIISESR